MTSLSSPGTTLPTGLINVQIKKTSAQGAGVPVVEQSGSLAFAKSATVGVDSTARFSDLNIAAATNKLAASVSLKAGQKYGFSFYFKSGGPKVTLIDDKGKRSTVSMASGFTVARTGNYQLVFEAGYSLTNAANFNNLSLTAKSVLPKSSGDSRIDALIRGGTTEWWHDYDAVAAKGTDKITSKALGLDASSSATALTYSFLSSQPSGQAMNNFQPMTEAQRDAVRKAFAYYANLINVTFTEVQGDGAGDINFGTNDQAASAGYANLPNGSATKDKDYLYLASNASTNGDQGVQEGGYGWTTILHEIGHTLGLKHPGNYNAGGGGTPGPYLPATTDSHQFSIMSYKDNNSSRGVNAKTAMVYDVAALQYLYGANKSASTAQDGTFAFAAGSYNLETLWSANGTDKIDLSQLTHASNIDLNAGAYSSINIIAAAKSTYYSGNNNVGIAHGSKINNVALSSTNGVAEKVTLNNAFTYGAFDSIESFDALDDKISLKKSLFGSLTAKNIEFGAAATKSTSKLIVNQQTGEIFYDSDGSGTKAVAKKIAQFTAVAGRGAISASNFAFVA